MVPAEGEKTAKIAFIGMAPSYREVEKLRPFVGPAGFVFEQCLHAAGIARAECYITNVIKFQPEGNDLTKYFSRKGEILPDALPIIESLKRELDEIDADVLVPLGNFPLKVLTGKDKITKMRGSILNSTLLPGRKVIPSIHPADIIYGGFISRYFIVEDFKRILRESEFSDIRLKDRKYIIRPSSDESISWLNSHRYMPEYAFDIETVNNEVSCISFAPSDVEAISIPVDKYSPQKEAECWVHINKILNDPNTINIGQNLIFDTQFLLSHNKIQTRGKICDTMIAHHIIYPDFPKGLDFLVSMHCNGEPYYKDEGKTWREKDVPDWDKFWLYNAKDSIYTYEVWKEIEPELDEGYRKSYDDTVKLFDSINFMVLHGIPKDEEMLEKTRRDVDREIDRLQIELNKLTGQPLKARSNKECKEYFYGKLGLAEMTRYDSAKKTSRVTVDEKALAALATGSKNRKPITEASLVLKIRKASNFKSKYLNILFDADDRFRCSYNLRGTPTGRLASSKTINGTGANHQNLPKRFKGFLIPDDGFIFIEWDKRQAEWVVVAYESGDASMINVIEEGLDAHAISGSMISGLPIEYVILENKYVEHTRDAEEVEVQRKKLDLEHPEWSRESLLKIYPNAFWPRAFSIRQMGKHSNHGWNYDMSAQRFASEYETTLEEAKLIDVLYHKAYPGVKHNHKRIVEQLSKDRTLITAFERKRVFFEEWNDALFRKAYDYGPQSTVADNTNLGMRRIYSDDADFMKENRILLNGHDSVWSEYPFQDTHNLAKVIHRGIEHLHEDLKIEDREFYIRTDVKIGFNGKDMIELKEIESIESIQGELSHVIQEARSKADRSKETSIFN